MSQRSTTPTHRAAPYLLAATVLAGCATPQQTSGLECGVGAAVGGYVVCKLLGHSDAHCAQFAVAAGGVGAAGCYTYANRLEKRRQELAGKEQNLDAQLRYVRGLNEDGQQLNKELRGRVNVAAKRVDELKVQTANKRLSAEQVAKERKQIDEEINAAGRQVALQGDALKEVKGYQAKRTSPELDAEIAKQERLLAEARGQLAALSQLKERVV